MLRNRAVPLIAMTLVACGGAFSGEPSSATEPEPLPTTTTPPSPARVIVPPVSEGNFPGEMIVSCSNGRFPISALQEIKPLMEADPGVAEAIAPFLANEEGQRWPQEGWQVLHETENEIQLVAKREGGLLAFMTVTNDGSGWSWSAGSLPGDPCELEFTVPEHLNSVDWRIDPEAPELTALSTQINVVLQERECVGGQEIGDRLVGPEVVMTPTQVFVAFAAQRPEGEAFDCQGNPERSAVVELPQPLGQRELVEGSRIGIDLADYVE